MTVLEKIINDYAYKSDTLKRIGIVGNFARGDYNDESDIDLVFDSDNHDISDDILKVGLPIKSILSNQFNRNLDIINYQTILNRKDIESENYIRCGYQKMYEDLIWIWRRNNELH